LLEQQPLLRRFRELAAPALASESLTSIQALVWAVSLACVEQRTVEAAAVYVFGRAMAAANVKRLAFCAGTAPPDDANAFVAEREREYGGDDFGRIVTTTVTLSVLGFGISAYLAWQLLGFLSSSIFGS